MSKRKKTCYIPLSNKQEEKLQQMLKWCYPNTVFEICHYSNACTHLAFGSVKEEKKEDYPNQIPWLEFVLVNLSAKILGKTAPNQKKAKGRRSYNMRLMGDNFGKSHPVDYLHGELEKVIEKQVENEQLSIEK